MSQLQEQFAQSAANLIQEAVTLGYTVTLGEAWRTPQQAQWNADHGTGIAHSLHIERLAIDLNFFKDGALITDGSKLENVGAWWEALGPMYRWGGRFEHLPDGNHFSLSPDGHIA
jgi:D-alanyl-D-alanine carboxypeptidase-like protein